MLNHTTLSRRRAITLFATTARNVRRALGYYDGKATQEETYATGPTPVTLVRTTAWFSLAETFLTQLRVSSLAIVPRMRLRPLHPEAAEEAIAEAVELGPAPAHAVRVQELSGPDEIDAATLARQYAAAKRLDVKVLGNPMPILGLRNGVLPDATVHVDVHHLTDWLDNLAGTSH